MPRLVQVYDLVGFSPERLILLIMISTLHGGDARGTAFPSMMAPAAEVRSN